MNKDGLFCKTLSSFACCAQKIIGGLEALSSLFVLGIRLWIANIFWHSGLTKIADFSTTIALFADEYKVPVLPPELAAYLASATELTVPVLLLVGLASRLGAVALLCMTAVIEFTYMSFPEHQMWALVLLVIVLFGPGKLSIDYYLSKRFFGIASRP